MGEVSSQSEGTWTLTKSTGSKREHFGALCECHVLDAAVAATSSSKEVTKTSCNQIMQLHQGLKELGLAKDKD